ncbi:MAG TPA: SAM-dependent chlorinase/fluorinase [Bryobacteraceae bacterium]|nr:SAM-dependent chlorinase/fluorinase [Bryobacteraceae bacterium]
MAGLTAPPIITLTTDFGLSDHYVGTIKGVILTRCPNATIVDITHELPPFSILAGAYAISQTASFFPAGTIHVIVVDPGVGTERKAVLAEASNQFFVAPDNGLLTLILNRDKRAVVREITNRSLWLDSPSQTFHGRDVFSPVAAFLASGKAKPEDVGPVLDHPERFRDISPRQVQPGVWEGVVLSADRFGNLITNFLSSTSGTTFILDVNRHKVNRFHKTFGEASTGILFAYHGSSGFVEVGMNQQSAADALGVSPGDRITMFSAEAVQSW